MMKRKSIVLILALIVILIMVQYSAFAEENVQISVPAEYSIDGKTSYDLTQAEYEELLKQVHDSIQSKLDDMCRGFLNYESMSANDDCTSFTIVVNDVMQTDEEIAAESLMYDMRAQYAAYSGGKADGIRIFYDNMVGDTLWSKDVGEPDPLVLKSTADQAGSSTASNASNNSSKPASTPSQTFEPTPVPVSYASSEEIQVIFDENGKNYEIGWDTKLKELPRELNFVYGLNYVPYWSAPDVETEIKDGYRAGQDNFISRQNKLDRFSVDKITLYYACEFNESGYTESVDNASLYMAEYNMAPWTSDWEIDPFIEKCTAKYGEPLINEAANKGLTMSGNSWSSTVRYDREYLWRGAADTALRLVFNCDSHNNRISACKVYIGKTNYDVSLKAGKLTQAPNFVRALVAVDNLPLYDKNGSLQVKMKYGQELVITGYNQQDDMFNADAVIIETQTTIDGQSIKSSSTRYDYTGKMKGDGLNVDRDDLIYYFLVDSSAIPVQRQLDLPDPNKSDQVNDSVLSEKHNYVLNKRSEIFHYPDCDSVRKMSAKNREDVFMSREDLIHAGYNPCQNCNP